MKKISCPPPQGQDGSVPPPPADLGDANNEVDEGEGDTAELMERLASAAPTFHGRKGRKKARPPVGESGSGTDANRSKRIPAAVGAPTDAHNDPWKEFRQDGYHGFADNNDDLNSFMAHTMLPGTVATGDDQGGGQPRDSPLASTGHPAKVPQTQADLLKQGPADMASLAKYIGERKQTFNLLSLLFRVGTFLHFILP